MILSILIVLVCTLLILVFLIQNSKGGGIQSQFGAATQIMGVKRGTEFIEKATWGLAITLILLSVLMSPQGTVTTSDEDNGSVAKVSGFANIDFMPSIQLGVGYNLGAKDQQTHCLWLKPKIFWQLPFNNLALPHLAVQAGYTLNLKTN